MVRESKEKKTNKQKNQKGQRNTVYKILKRWRTNFNSIRYLNKTNQVLYIYRFCISVKFVRYLNAALSFFLIKLSYKYGLN